MFLKFLLICSLGSATASMAIKNNTLAYTMWQKPPTTSLIKIYLFNYTNWEEVKNGSAEKLHVEEVGPYAYSQQLERVNIQLVDDMLTYQEKKTWTFLPEQTTGALFDQVNVPNLPLLEISSFIANSNFNRFLLSSLEAVINMGRHHHEAFVKLPVHSFLWGYDDSIIHIANSVISPEEGPKFDQFGLLVRSNGTTSNRLAINTGAKDINKLNVIEQLNGLDHMNYWGNPACNSVKGSEGSRFPVSWLDRNTTLQILFPDLCRKLPFIYEKDVEVANQEKVLRYRLPTNVFDNPETNPENQCYCENNTRHVCPPRGVIDASACGNGYPAMVSFPHFYLGDPKLREQMTGLNFNHPEEINDTFIDVHPASGITLNRRHAFQLNIQVKKHPSFTSLGFLKQDMILPIARVDLTEEGKLEDIQSLINHENQDVELEEQKTQNFEEYMTNEVREMRKQMSAVVDLLTTINRTQSEFVNKISEDINVMKYKINGISTKVDIASLLNNNSTR